MHFRVLWWWKVMAIKKLWTLSRSNVETILNEKDNGQHTFAVKLLFSLSNVRYFVPYANVRCFSPVQVVFCPSRTSHGSRSWICRIERFRLTDFTGFRIPIADPILSTAREDFGSAYEVDKEKPSIRSSSSGPRSILGALRNLSVRDRT